MNACDEWIPMLVRAADGTLDVSAPSDRAALQAHLSVCRACTEALADQRVMHESLTALATLPALSSAGARAMATLRAQSDAGAAGWLESLDWRRWTWRLVPVAVVLAVMVASVARTDASGLPTAEATEVTQTEPSAPALVTGEVSARDLLSLLLSATPDEALLITNGENR